MNAEIMKMLVVEDDPKIASFIVKGFRQAGYVVDQCGNGADALARGTAGAYDMAIVDVMLPGMDGLQLVRALRERNIRLPVLFLSAKGTVDDRVRGLEVGGDDYMVKPFAFSELFARVQALMRRAGQASPEPTRLTFGSLVLDMLSREVTRDGVAVELQAKEFTLLEFLMRNPGRVVTKTMILERVWDFSFDPQTNVVDVLVHRLRAKVDPDKNLIHTIRGVGYVLRNP